jgi:hypothetical protein
MILWFALLVIAFAVIGLVALAIVSAPKRDWFP